MREYDDQRAYPVCAATNDASGVDPNQPHNPRRHTAEESHPQVKKEPPYPNCSGNAIDELVPGSGFFFLVLLFSLLSFLTLPTPFAFFLSLPVSRFNPLTILVRAMWFQGPGLGNTVSAILPFTKKLVNHRILMVQKSRKRLH